MISNDKFVKLSLELNLFFQRIMKEHLFFIETNLQPINEDLVLKTKELKIDFESLLATTVYYASGFILDDFNLLKEFITPYTLKAEELTSKLTGASINTNIKKLEMHLGNNNKLKDLNDKTLNTTLKDELNFWNHIMEEHAMFIDGLLDPTEKNLKQAANLVAKSFEKLLNQSINLTQNLLIKESIESTNKIISYKEAATSGLLKCQIKSIIPPLLADHVLREANYYLRILNIFCK